MAVDRYAVVGTPIAHSLSPRIHAAFAEQCRQALSYEAIEIPRPGHPTAVDWQPGLDDEPANSPSHVLFSGRIGESHTLVMTPDFEAGDGFISSYLVGPPKVRSGGVRRQIAQLTLRPE